MVWEYRIHCESDIRKVRSPGRHLQNISFRPRPDERRLINSSAMGAIPLIKAGQEKPEACWAGSEE